MSFVNIFGGVVEGLEKGLEQAGKNIQNYQNAQYKAQQIQTIQEERQRIVDAKAQQEQNMVAMSQAMKEFSQMDMADWNDSQIAMNFYNLYGKYGGKTTATPNQFLGFILKSKMESQKYKRQVTEFEKKAQLEKDRTSREKVATIKSRNRGFGPGGKSTAATKQDISKHLTQVRGLIKPLFEEDPDLAGVLVNTFLDNFKEGNEVDAYKSIYKKLDEIKKKASSSDEEQKIKNAQKTVTKWYDPRTWFGEEENNDPYNLIK